MTDRQMCEARLMWYLEQMVEEYHKYNPDGEYLSLSYSNADGEEHYNVYNRYYGEEGADKERKVDICKIGCEYHSF